jgi:hypothetical protein
LLQQRELLDDLLDEFFILDVRPTCDMELSQQWRSAGN